MVKQLQAVVPSAVALTSSWQWELSGQMGSNTTRSGIHMLIEWRRFGKLYVLLKITKNHKFKWFFFCLSPLQVSPHTSYQ